MLAAGGAWPLLVALTPAADRPWISGTADNSILSLIFGYNGFGRVSGQTGGPGGTGGGAAFGGSPGPFRLLNGALGGQDGWLLGLAVVGRGRGAHRQPGAARDPRTAWLIAVGGAFIVTAVLFSAAQGIFHPYYVVLLAPFTAALVGAGVGDGGPSRWSPSRSPARLRWPPGVACEFVVLHNYSGQLAWLRVVLPIVCGLAAVALFVFQGRARAHLRRCARRGARCSSRRPCGRLTRSATPRLPPSRPADRRRRSWGPAVVG